MLFSIASCHLMAFEGPLVQEKLTHSFKIAINANPVPPKPNSQLLQMLFQAKLCIHSQIAITRPPPQPIMRPFAPWWSERLFWFCHCHCHWRRSRCTHSSRRRHGQWAAVGENHARYMQQSEANYYSRKMVHYIDFRICFSGNTDTVVLVKRRC